MSVYTTRRGPDRVTIGKVSMPRPKPAKKKKCGTCRGYHFKNDPCFDRSKKEPKKRSDQQDILSILAPKRRKSSKKMSDIVGDNA